MNTQTQGVQQVPLIQLLRRVPENAKLIVDSADGMGSTFHPVGRLCHEAAEALAQPEQEPVAWIEVTTHHEKYQTSKVILLDKGIKLPHDTPLYTHPAPATEQEPVAMYENGNVNWINTPKDNSPLYTHHAPSFIGLSDDEIDKLYADWERGQTDYLNFARAIEQALKEKNT